MGPEYSIDPIKIKKKKSKQKVTNEGRGVGV